MDRLQGLISALDYIENHLADEIEYKEIERMTGWPIYQFQRLFSYLLDVTLAEYIRRRRLSLAAFELQDSQIKVIDLALKYGYDSPNSFTRAFQKLHSVTPTSARRSGASLKSYPRLSFVMAVKGDVAMNYRIEETESYTVFGKSFTIGVDDNPYVVIPEFWKSFQEDGTYARICRTAGFEPYSGKLLNGAHYDFNNGGKYHCKYIIHTRLPEGVKVPDEFETLEIPKTKWVAFYATFKTVEESTPALQDLWKRIYAEWFPTSTDKLMDGPYLEVIQSYSQLEVWLPSLPG